MREVTINEEAVMLVASPFTPFIYENEFDGDMMGALMSLMSKEKDESKRHYGSVPKMAWAMAKCAKHPAPFPDFQAWLEAMGGWDFSDEALNRAVILEATRGLFRGKAAMVSAFEAQLEAATAGGASEPGNAGDGQEDEAVDR